MLSTPPAFVLSQDQTLIKYEYLISQINFLFNLPLSLLAVLLFFQCTVAFVLRRKLVYYTTLFHFCQVLFSTFLKKFLSLICVVRPLDANFYIIQQKSVFVKYFFSNFSKVFEEVLCCNLPFGQACILYYKALFLSSGFLSLF